MKYIIVSLLILSLFTSCKREKYVDAVFADSLINNYTASQLVTDNNADMEFWRKRINPNLPGQVNESRYASTLSTRFRQLGDIRDIEKADSILRSVNKTYNNSLSGPFVALTANAMQQHRFSQADTLLRQAMKIGIDGYTTKTLYFDVNFELGNYSSALLFLKQIRKTDYGYNFRLSKMEHLNGTLDKAIAAMSLAADEAGTSPYLKAIALSNTADLYIHNGDLQKAADLYKQCIRINSADFHSIAGLGWVAMIHDNDFALAGKLFTFVKNHNKLPDMYFKFYQLAQSQGNKVLEKKYATAFVQKATIKPYGQMYNKYTIEIYAGGLNNPAMAETLARNELNNRATPQTYAWYAYALFMNNKKAQAYKVFQQHVSDQPLEGLELYYMGKMMKGLGKGYDAHEFFKAAKNNIYDLSPAMQSDILAALKE